MPDAVRAWREEIAADPRRVVVVDDDPTGTQTVSGLRVLLRPDPCRWHRFAVSGAPAVFAMSNSRALPRDAAAALVHRIVGQARAALRAAGAGEPAVLLRGDSTLRGHVFAETDAVAANAPVLFVPAFVAGGRITVGGVHYLRDGHRRIPVHHTEYARDPVFGYRSARLTDWVTQVSGGRHRAVPVDLAVLRADGPDAVTRTLLAAGPRQVVVPDAETDEDIVAIAAGLVRAERAGARITVRCGASLAAVRAGTPGTPVERIPVRAPGRTLLVCGSFTDASSRQLAALGEWAPRRELVADGPPGQVGRIRRQLRDDLDAHGRAVLATQRAHAHHRADPLMDHLIEVVSSLTDSVDLVVAKGGITAARVARDAFGAAVADVLGQPEPGVVLWRLHHKGGRLPYVVVPGNIGTDTTLTRLLAAADRSPADRMPADA